MLGEIVDFKMICKVRSCRNYGNSNANDDDCILEFLDFIKLHYFHLQTELKEKSTSICVLEKENLFLNKTIDSLRQEIQSNSSTPLKRKKIDSIETPDSTILTGKEFLKENANNDDNDTREDLNIALTSNEIFDETCNSLYSPVQTTNILKSPKKEIKSPSSSKLPLSPVNNIETKVNVTPAKNVMKERRNGTPTKLTPTKISHYLPKRIITKETISGKRVNIENENRPLEVEKSPKTTAGWLSTEKKNKKTSIKNFTRRGFEFIQPIKCDKNDSLDNSSESIASSQNMMLKQTARKDIRNLLSLKAKPQMKQAKLEFDKKKVNIPVPGVSKSDETICDEIVCASPGVASLNAMKEKNSFAQRSLRKFSRKNSDDELFNISIKKSTPVTSNNGNKYETKTRTGAQGCEGERRNIKTEMQISKNSCVTNLFGPENTRKNIKEPLITTDSIDDLSLDSIEENKHEFVINDDRNKDENLTGGSVLILPAQPDEVIVVDETENVDFGDIDTFDLFDEIMRKSDQTPEVLKKIEQKQILKHKKYVEKPLNKSIDDINNIVDIDSLSQLKVEDMTQLNVIDEKHLAQNELENNKEALIDKTKSKIPITLQSVGHNCDCRNCNSYLRYLIELNLDVDEIKLRLKQNTKHAERPLKLHLTPEGFWDPVMRSFAEGDPRNEVILDTRFINKNKENQKRLN